MLPQPFLDLVLLGWRNAREDQPPDSRAVERLFDDGRIQNEALSSVADQPQMMSDSR